MNMPFDEYYRKHLEASCRNASRFRNLHSILLLTAGVLGLATFIGNSYYIFALSPMQGDDNWQIFVIIAVLLAPALIVFILRRRRGVETRWSEFWLPAATLFSVGRHSIIVVVLAFAAFAIYSSDVRSPGEAHFASLMFLLDGTCCLILLLLWPVNKHLQSRYESIYKRELAPKILARLDPELQYHPDGQIARGDFEESGLWAYSVDCYSGDGLVQGRLRSSEFSISRVEAAYTEETNDAEIEVEFFSGTFLVVRLQFFIAVICVF